MPCFKGLAVSIHTPEGPLAEYSIQKQARQSRITSYIPVPPAKVPSGSLTGKPEQSTFAVSITLLVPGQRVPYSAPKSTPEDPYPLGRLVGALPGTFGDRGGYSSAIGPYIPRTGSPNETLAAYIYFDGRPKEEVATLLRKGEETWVNSRWVSVPTTEGGGLAEREFLFREVGLERWLNGLDLVGKEKDKAARIEKRHRKLEKRNLIKHEEMDSDGDLDHKTHGTNGVLRYGANENSPVENVIDDQDFSDDSDDEPPEAEAAGQIKVALFRVLASGEIKKGEYEPQFDAHDDEGETVEDAGGADIEHTTSFAKPKSLDPKSISTQTVTGLDSPDSPYAIFTFLYRGEKQLRKMGMLEQQQHHETPTATKRKSTDFSKLGPLNKFGTVGFTGYREQPKPKKVKDSRDDELMDDSDDDEKERGRDADDATVPAKNGEALSPLDVVRQKELAEGVRQIKLKRQHSSEPIDDARKSPHMKTSDLDTPPSNLSHGNDASALDISANTASPVTTLKLEAAVAIDEASPLKKHRPSLDNTIAGIHQTMTSTLMDAPQSVPTSEPTVGPATSAPPSTTDTSTDAVAVPLPDPIDEDEEL